MLYDPKWEKQTETKALTLPAFIAWLERQPADRAYDRHDPDKCVIAQFCNKIGFEPPVALFGWMADVAFCSDRRPDTFAFGAALKRAHKIEAAR